MILLEGTFEVSLYFGSVEFKRGFKSERIAEEDSSADVVRAVMRDQTTIRNDQGETVSVDALGTGELLALAEAYLVNGAFSGMFSSKDELPPHTVDLGEGESYIDRLADESRRWARKLRRSRRRSMKKTRASTRVMDQMTAMLKMERELSRLIPDTSALGYTFQEMAEVERSRFDSLSLTAQGALQSSLIDSIYEQACWAEEMTRFATGDGIAQLTQTVDFSDLIPSLDSASTMVAQTLTAQSALSDAILPEARQMARIGIDARPQGIGESFAANLAGFSANELNLIHDPQLLRAYELEFVTGVDANSLSRQFGQLTGAAMINFHDSEFRDFAEHTFPVLPVPDLLLEEAAAAYARVNLESMRSVIGNLSEPWLCATRFKESLSAIAGLEDLRTVLLSTTRLFSDDVSETLRGHLGNWTSVASEDVQRLFDEEDTSHVLRKYGVPDKYDLLSEEALDHLATPGRNARNGELRAQTAYRQLLRLERHLRSFIDAKMTAAYGRSWIKQKVDKKRREDWEAKRAKGQKGATTDTRLIDFADFTHYEAIITRQDVFNDVFKECFERRESIRESFVRLYPYRNAVMHARAMSRREHLLMVAEVERIIYATDGDSTVVDPGSPFDLSSDSSDLEW